MWTCLRTTPTCQSLLIWQLRQSVLWCNLTIEAFVDESSFRFVVHPVARQNAPIHLLKIARNLTAATENTSTAFKDGDMKKKREYVTFTSLIDFSGLRYSSKTS